MRTQNCQVEQGERMRQFLQRFGLPTSGGEWGGYTVFKKQMELLTACRLIIGMQAQGRIVTMDARAIRKFEVWLPVVSIDDQ